MTAGNVCLYCKQIELAQQTSIQYSLSTYFYWRKAFPGRNLPSVCFSSLLCSTLTSISLNTRNYPLDDVSLICNLSMKMIDFQENPLLLASVIVEAFSKVNENKSESVQDKASIDAIKLLRQSVITRYSYYFEHNLPFISSDQASLSTEIKEILDDDNHMQVFSLSDDGLSYITSIKRHIQMLTVNRSGISEVGMHERFPLMRQELINALMVGKCILFLSLNSIVNVNF
jgi:hypothetical protein